MEMVAFRVARIAPVWKFHAAYPPTTNTLCHSFVCVEQQFTVVRGACVCIDSILLYMYILRQAGRQSEIFLRTNRIVKFSTTHARSLRLCFTANAVRVIDNNIF